MAANGDIGLGTDSPLVNLHIVDGDSPTLRIEQDASGGWTPQSWDVSGNESNFFIRDNTNGSTLPFRIKPGAPQNALFIAANGNIGLGTATPNANASLELKSANKGFLLNRLTTAEKTTLQSLLVAEDIGLMVYDTDIKGLFSWDGTQWISVVNTDAQDLSLSTNTLSLTNDGTTVDLSGYLDNTDAQDLSLSTNTLSLTNDGTTVDLSGYLDNIDAQTVSLTGTTLAISNGNTLDLSSLQDGIGTDAQDLALTTNTLSLTNDGTPVDLSGYLDNTDAQTVSLTGTTLAISNGNTLNLSSLQDGIGTDAQDLSLSTNTLSLTNDGTPVDLSGYLDNTDAQTVSLTGTTLAISNGNNVDLSSLQDGIGTDAQDLTSAVLSGNVLEIEIENGNSVSVDLSPVLSSLQAEINTQSEMITDLVARIEAVEACACGGTLAAEGIQNKNSNFKLSQNKPNPFNGETKIDFKIPSDIQKAYIKIYDSNGKTLQKIAITQRGEGSITYDNDRFSSGLYYYSLFADNIKVDTKKMLLHNK
jgi:GH25 family lysozyme M1 (1,4-beta-N-acetylmuramidase)